MFEAYRACRLCPRDCGVDRTAGGLGVCRETAACRIASAGPHFGEEPSFSGTRGSGTIFFSGCSSRCFFCQNYQISIENTGREVAPDELLGVARRLAASGVHNINFVTPDHFWPHIEYVCRMLREEGVSVPFLFNSSGYQRPDAIARYAEWMNIFMPDFKFADPDLAGACMGDPRYPESALEALRGMVEAAGFLHPWDPTGRRPAETGVLVRHLILPGHVDNSLAALRLLRREFGRLLPMSVMSQFHPVARCRACGRLDRAITPEEHAAVRDAVLEMGFRHVYLQTLSHGMEFLPDFEREEPFEGNAGRNVRGLEKST